MDKPIVIELVSPNFITDKIDRNRLKETKGLFNNFKSVEHLVNKKKILIRK